jgi:hypothetical protein
MLELTSYLMVPWALVLPWSIIFTYNLVIMVLRILGRVGTPGLGEDLTQLVATLVCWYALSCLPVYVAAFRYGRQEHKVGCLRAFFIGHLLLVGNYVTCAACWRAVSQLITGSRGRAKTWLSRQRRASEPAPIPARTPAPTATAAPTPAPAPMPTLAPAAVPRAEILPPAQIQVPGPSLAAAGLAAAGLAGADDDATTAGIAAVREPVLAAVASHRGPAAQAPGRHALAGPAAPRGRAAQGSHRAGRSRSGHHSARRAR